MKRHDKIINYETLLKRNEQYNNMLKYGVVIIPKKRLKVFGYILIGLGVVTIPIPLTTLPFLTAGFVCLGLSYYKVKEETLRKLRVLSNKLR